MRTLLPDASVATDDPREVGGGCETGGRDRWGKKIRFWKTDFNWEHGHPFLSHQGKLHFPKAF